MGILSGEATLFFKLPSISLGVNSKRRKNAFLQENILFGKRCIVQESKQEVTKVVSLCKMIGTHGGVLIHLKTTYIFKSDT